MYISEIKIENFRLFGAGRDAFLLQLEPGLTALVGENDAGKTAVIDALRLVLGTRDREFLRLDEADFHYPPGGTQTEQISIRLTLSGLSVSDRAAFAEYLSYDPTDPNGETQLVLTWIARRQNIEGASRRSIPPELRTGASGDGPTLDGAARSLLTATYLRPLRDAERAMRAGRGSRLSQVLQHTREITETGVPFDSDADPPVDPKTLSVLGLGDYANYLIGESEAVRDARAKLNEHFLGPLSFANDTLSARIAVSGSRDANARLRQLLEKLELGLSSPTDADADHSRGLGSNNLLFMACELLLLASESDGFPLLIIEEPEAHLHPQRQLRLMSFLQEQSEASRSEGKQIQILVTTHSPNLASHIRLENLVLIQDGRAFPMGKDHTLLSESDYRFLERFLDVTKANLFFARAVMIVEGAAETILLPALARLIGRDFHHYGVSIVNVGGVGLSRYARIFMRKDAEASGEVEVPVACITDLDVMPDAAPWILGKVNEGEEVPEIGKSRRRWRRRADFPGNELEKRREELRSKASGQKVKAFVAGEWTLEYDLVFHGLSEQVWSATHMALADEKLVTRSIEKCEVLENAATSFQALKESGLDEEKLATTVYAELLNGQASKAIVAQYLAEILEDFMAEGTWGVDELLERLPPYLIQAIEYVTEPLQEPLKRTEETATAEAARLVDELPQGAPEEVQAS